MSKSSIFRGQLSLLGTLEQRQRRRVALDATSWVEHVPQWLSDDEKLFDVLSNVANWEQRTRWIFERYVLVHSVPKETQPALGRISVNFASSTQAAPAL